MTSVRIYCFYSDPKHPRQRVFQCEKLRFLTESYATIVVIAAIDRSCQQCHQARAKVRANDVRLTYVWSSLELTKSLLLVGKTLFLGNGAGCDFGSNLRCALHTYCLKLIC